MEDIESFRGERCGIDNCRSRRYHQNEEGTYECENGHVHSQIRVQGEDEDAFYATSGRVTRTDSGSEVREKVSRHFEGNKGFELFLQCYQLLLRKQCSFLVKSKGFPEEIETVVRDLWTFRIQALPHRIDEINTIASDSESQSQVFSSQSEDEDTTAASTSKRGSATPRLIDTLALVYLAGLLLRLPLLPADLHRWTLSGELLYYEARNFTPPDMLARLPATYQVLLEPRDILSVDALNSAVKDVALFYRRDVGMKIPPLNMAPLLLRLMEKLALPLPVYAAVKWLQDVCGFGLDYADWEAERGKKITQASMPNAQLAALIVVATKLLYPFDDVERRPDSTLDPSILSVDWGKWVEIMRPEKRKREKQKEAMSYADAMAIREEDVWSMSRKRLDEYMAFYAETWARDNVDDHSKDAGARKELFQMFPKPEFAPRSQNRLTPGQGVADTEMVKAAMNSLKVNAVVEVGEHESPPKPGSYYRQWRNEEDLNAHATVFSEEVGSTLGISVPRLIRATFYTERRMARWANEQKKSEARDTNG